VCRCVCPGSPEGEPAGFRPGTLWPSLSCLVSVLVGAVILWRQHQRSDHPVARCGLLTGLHCVAHDDSL